MKSIYGKALGVEVWRKQAAYDLRKANESLMRGDNPSYNKYYFNKYGRFPWQMPYVQCKPKAVLAFVNPDFSRKSSKDEDKDNRERSKQSTLAKGLELDKERI